MFILEAFSKLIPSYVYYLSTLSFIALSLLISVGKGFQALYCHKKHKIIFFSLEFMVEIIRFCLFILIFTKVMDFPLDQLTSTEFWDKVFLSTSQVTMHDLSWDIVGFVVVFSLYSLMLHMIFTKHAIARIVKACNVTKFTVEELHLAILQVYKNLLVIPVGFIFILKIINLL